MNENDILIRCDELDWQPTFPGGWIKPLELRNYGDRCENP
jgi:hypothetical protein